MAEPDIQAEVQQNFKHNFTVNVLDGTFFWLSTSFFATRTIAPLFLSYLTDNTFVFGLLAMIVSTGWLLPQLFTANWVQRTPRKKDIVVKYGFFTERVPILLLVSAAWLTIRSEMAAIVLFIFLIGWHVIGAGVVAVGWQDLIARIFPTQWRGRFFGVSNALGNGTGILAASGAAWLLGHYPFPTNFMITFTFAGVFMFLSWFLLAQTREPTPKPAPQKVSSANYWKTLPAILKSDHNFRRYLVSQILTTMGSMAIGYLTIYTLRTWQVEASVVGLYTTSLLAGTALTNLLLGWLADKTGHKLTLEVSTVLSALAILIALLAPSPAWFYLAFALQGGSQAGFVLSGISIIFEFCEEEVRPTYIGLSNSVIGIFAGIAPLLGGILVEQLGFGWMFSINILFQISGLALLHFTVQEPRKSPVTPVVSVHPPPGG